MSKNNADQDTNVNVTQVRVVTDDGHPPMFTLPVTEEALRKLYSDGTPNWSEYAAGRTEIKEGFFQKYWRPAVAILYILLLILDYMVRPVVNQMTASEIDFGQTVGIVKQLDPTIQLKALEIQTKQEKWPPILPEFLHMALGAIITASAATRGWEKANRAKHGGGGEPVAPGNPKPAPNPVKKRRPPPPPPKN